MPTHQEWVDAKVRVPELRKLCTDNQLPSDGVMNVLIGRLVAKGVALPGAAGPVDWEGLVAKSCEPGLVDDLVKDPPEGVGKTQLLGWASSALSKLMTQPAQPLLTWDTLMGYKVRYTAQGNPQYLRVGRVPDMHVLEMIEEVVRTLLQNNPLPPGCTTEQAEDLLEMMYRLGLKKTQPAPGPAGAGAVGPGRELAEAIEGFRGAVTQREPAHKAVTASEIMTGIMGAQQEGNTLRLADLPKMAQCGLIRASVQRDIGGQYCPLLAMGAEVLPPKLVCAEDAEGGVAQDEGYETKVVDGRLVTTSALSTKKNTKNPSKAEAVHGIVMYFNGHYLAWAIRDKAVPLSPKFLDASGKEMPWASGYYMVRLRDFTLDLLRSERVTGTSLQRVGLFALKRCHTMVNDPFSSSHVPTLNVVIEYFITEVVRDINLLSFTSVPRIEEDNKDEASDAETVLGKRKVSVSADTMTTTPVRMCRSKDCSNRAGKLKNPAGYCGPCHRKLKRNPAPRGAAGAAPAPAAE